MNTVVGGVFEVPPLSWRDIEGVADDLRAALGLMSTCYFPVGFVIEQVLEEQLPGYVFDVGDFELMGSAEGETAPDGSFIRLRDDVYEALHSNDGRARFTAAHELGHFLLHRNVPMQRATPGSIQTFRNSEAQANHFAACVLMPTNLILPGMSARDIAHQFCVSAKAAQNRFENLGLKGVHKEKGKAAKFGSFPNLFSRD